MESPGLARLCHYHDQIYTKERLVGKCEYLTCYHEGTMAWQGIKLCARHVKPARSAPAQLISDYRDRQPQPGPLPAGVPEEPWGDRTHHPSPRSVNRALGTREEGTTPFRELTPHGPPGSVRDDRLPYPSPSSVNRAPGTWEGETSLEAYGPP
eukprot:1140752-Heterocapsa_arctica.AAC.1